MDPQEAKVTLGEVYRLIQAQSADLAEIKADVKSQNGRVAAHETRITVLEDRGSRDAAARVTGAGGLLGSVGALLWQLFTK